MSTIFTTEPAPTLEDVWRLFRENAEQSRENAREAKRRFQETERLMRESSQETDRKLQESAAQVRDTSKKVKELEQLFTSQWGRLVESLVEGAVVQIFNNRGLPIKRTMPRVRGSYDVGQSYEFDIIALNGDVVVIIEVKTTLRPKDVKKFMHKLDQAKEWMEEYADKRIHGAMAFLQADADAEQMVINRGLFAIRATGDSAHIVNPQGFAPRIW